MDRTRKIRIVSLFLSGLITTVVLWLITASWLSQRLGVKKTEAMLLGDDSVQLTGFEVQFHERQVRCSDPVSLRYFEKCFRENSPTEFDRRITYRVNLQYSGDGRLTIRTDWARGGFLLCMPGDTLLQDGGEPRAWVVFRPPIPEPVKEMIDFLNDESGKADGNVLIMEEGGNRREQDPTLLRP